MQKHKLASYKENMLTLIFVGYYCIMKANKRKISWNPNVDPVVEERYRCINMSDMEYWESMMKLICMNRKGPVTFEKRKIQWT